MVGRDTYQQQRPQLSYLQGGVRSVYGMGKRGDVPERTLDWLRDGLERRIVTSDEFAFLLTLHQEYLRRN